MVGLGLTVVYVIVQEGRWPLWAAVGAGVVSFIAVATASAGCLSERSPGSARLLQVQEATASLLAAQLFLLFYATAATVAAAAGATVSSTMLRSDRARRCRRSVAC